MKNFSVVLSIIFVICTLLTFSAVSGCKRIKNPVKYEMGTFPDTATFNIEGLNTQYDDYNSNLYMIGGAMPIIFSSNRGSNGLQYDLVQGVFWFQFDQTTGKFDMGGEMINDPFYAALIGKANTAGDDLGPCSFLSSPDGFEYLVVASQTTNGDRDLYYLKNLPRFGTEIPTIYGPYSARLLNTSFDDEYFCFDSNKDTAYFSSNRDGRYHIYFHERPVGLAADTWLNQDFSPSTMVDSINSTSDDRCPLISRNIMGFASNRDGGLGGYDLYYSVFKNGKWNSPVNFGPPINSEADEFRPILGYHYQYKNDFLIFSSNRTGGLGGYDLYFAGYTFNF